MWFNKKCWMVQTILDYGSLYQILFLCSQFFCDPLTNIIYQNDGHNAQTWRNILGGRHSLFLKQEKVNDILLPCDLVYI